MRLSIAEALRYGLISTADANAMSRGRAMSRATCKARRAASTPAAAPSVDPQRALHDALVNRLGAAAVGYEVGGLVPGRRYRADIVIHQAHLVIEFDGFAFHRSKSAFQRDRDRQNALVREGWQVMRFVNKQIHHDLDSVVAQIVDVVDATRARQDLPAAPRPNAPVGAAC